VAPYLPGSSTTGSPAQLPSRGYLALSEIMALDGGRATVLPE
jgi:hypothetical protein